MVEYLGNIWCSANTGSSAVQLYPVPQKSCMYRRNPVCTAEILMCHYCRPRSSYSLPRVAMSHMDYTRETHSHTTKRGGNDVSYV
eukprot:SAG11_NODE_83_length_17378_cov_5.388622_5_plen_85_part_00